MPLTFCAVELTLTLLQIVHNLSRATDVDASLGRLEERSRHVQINEESLCDSCHARLGTKLFAMYPDDTIVCYKVGNIDILFISVFIRSKPLHNHFGLIDFSCGLAKMVVETALAMEFFTACNISMCSHLL